MARAAAGSAAVLLDPAAASGPPPPLALRLGVPEGHNIQRPMFCASVRIRQVLIQSPGILKKRDIQ